MEFHSVLLVHLHRTTLAKAVFPMLGGGTNVNPNGWEPGRGWEREDGTRNIARITVKMWKADKIE